MNSKILKLDAPYNVIYAGGLVGRHIATMVTWTEDEDGEMTDTVSYPIIDRGEEFPAGKLVMEDLDDCRVICPNGKKTNLYWLAHIIEYDFQQLEPAGTEYIIERTQRLGCKIVFPKIKNENGVEITKWDFNATLYITPLNASWEEKQEFIVKSNVYEGFYFQAEGTAHEIQNELEYQLSVYTGYFPKELIRIRFQTSDFELDDVIKYLNKSQGIKNEDNAY